MEHSQVRYGIKSRPRKIEKIAQITIGIGVALLVFGDVVIGPIFKILPLELIVFLLGEYLAQFFGLFWFLGLFIMFSGIYLLRFNSYAGAALYNLSDETIYLSGKISTFIDIKDIREMMIYPFSVLGKHAIRFKIEYDQIILRFRNKKELVEFIELIIPSVNKYQKIDLKSYYVE